MNILIAIDSFKECLNSSEISEAIATGISKVDSCISITQRSLADGGEGTLNAFNDSLKNRVKLSTLDPLGRRIDAEYGILKTNTVIIELAQASGLELLTKEEQNPLITSTFGTGLLLKKAIEEGYRNFIIGLGGSATNDAATGLLKALGFQFLDHDKSVIEKEGGQILESICYIDNSQVIEYLDECTFTLACDVQNPFSGKNGAAYIFSPQKGATREDVEILDRGLVSFSEVIKKEIGIDINPIEGAGAAGGVGGGLVALLNAKIKSGIELIIENIGLEEHIKNADLVYTGEGKLDKQTLQGKVPVGIAKICMKHNTPVIGIGGVIDLDAIEGLNQHFTALFSIQTEPCSKELAMQPDYAKQRCENIGMQSFKLVKAFK
ncbi:glycerate kinase family protein [Sediminitomix flava]|uniref:Glycerate kinase n=1 Tax=Sediminitomix flava TaxID=379075 RepID=A0A315ZIB5_SEDFL|nr:glycerate kinase [Sediminitomix flava]PWJ44454.1 glycerate kinase [Sediminitomix flava]